MRFSRTKATPAEHCPRQESSGPRPGSRWVRWLVLAMFWTLGPVIILGGVESVLRVAGYGKPTRPFLRHTVDGHDCWVRNLEYLQIFFPFPVHRYGDMWKVEVPAEKAQDTYRVFVFGSSAALGWPDAKFGFARMLELMLERQYPQTRFEVFNLASEMVNSHVMRAIALECARMQPDLFVVYMGNNEFVGPFGAMESGRPRTRIPSVASVHAYVWLSNLRLLQWTRPYLPQSLAWSSAPSSGAADERVDAIYSNYASNLDDICSAGISAGARVFLSTVGTNLRDWGPSQSGHRPGLPPEDLSAWQAAYDAGKGFQAQGQFGQALQSYAQAERIDDTYAELHFRKGQCFWHQENYEASQASFVQALEHDDLFCVRAKPRLNAVIRGVAEAHRAEGAVLVDAAQRFSEGSPHGIPGIEFFSDYCHLSPEGHYQLASAVYEQVVQHLPERIKKQGPVDAAPLSFAELMRFSGGTPSVMRAYWQTVLDANKAIGRLPAEGILEAKIAEWSAAEKTDAAADRLGIVKEALSGMPHDYYFQLEYGQILLTSGRIPEAQEQVQGLLASFPARSKARELLATIYMRTGQPDAARAEYAKLSALYPDEAVPVIP